jgi:hypothetical protein
VEFLSIPGSASLTQSKICVICEICGFPFISVLTVDNAQGNYDSADTTDIQRYFSVSVEKKFSD